LLKRAIRSVLDQTYSKLECIVVDDASRDNTEGMISSFEDDRLRYFRHEKNKGASAARNTGIKHSKGELIAFLDDDDEWLSAKLEKQVPLINGLPESVGMVYCWMDYLDENGKTVLKHHPILKGYVFPQLLDAQRLGGCPTLLVRRKVLDKIRGFDETLIRGNDGDFIRRVCFQYEVDFIPEVLVKVHVGHADRISVDSSKSLRLHIQASKSRLKKFREEYNKYPEAKAKLIMDLSLTHVRLKEWKIALVYFLKIVLTLNVRINKWVLFLKKIF